MAVKAPEKGVKSSSNMGSMPQGYVDMLKTSFELLKAPQETMNYRDRANIKDPIILLAIVGLIAGVLSAVVNFVVSMVTGNPIGAIAALLVMPIMMLILMPVLALILQGVIYLVAKALGGKATYTEQLYLTTLATITGSLIVSVVSAIPCIGLVAMLGSLYLLYVQIVVVRDAHQMTMLNAAIAVLVPIVLAMIVIFVFLLAGLAVLGLGAAGLAASAYGTAAH